MARRRKAARRGERATTVVGRRATSHSGGYSARAPRSTRAVPTLDAVDNRAAAQRAPGVVLQVHTCAFLHVGGVVMCLLAVSDELCLHLPAGQALCFALLLTALGSLIGTWGPRALIRRRIAASPDTNAAKLVTADLEFAGVLTGALYVALGIAVVLLALATGKLEAWRAFLAARVAHPVALEIVWLLLPIAALTIFVAITNAASLTALQGWHRLATQPRSNVARLWLVLLLGAAFATTACLVQEVRTRAVWIAPVLVFSSALLPVLRKPPIRAGAPAPRLPSRFAWQQWGLLPTVAIGAALVAICIALRVPTPELPPSGLSLITLLTLLSAAVGVGAARLFLRLTTRIDCAPFGLLAAVAALLFATRVASLLHASDATATLASVTTAVSMTIVLTGRRITIAVGNARLALARVGMCVAIGLIVGSAASMVAIATDAWHPVLTWAPLLALAAAGLSLVLDDRTHAVARLLGLLAVVGLLGFLPGASRSIARPRALPPPASAAHADTRAQLFGDRFEQRVLPADSAITWWGDLAGPHADIIFVASQSHPHRDSDAPRNPLRARRLLRRAQRVLLAGGRLVIELPTSDNIERVLTQTPLRRWSAARSADLLTLQRPYETYRALIFGEDTAALLQHRYQRRESRPLLVPLQLTGGAPAVADDAQRATLLKANTNRGAQTPANPPTSLP